MLGLGCTVVDITEHKQAEAVLQRAVDFREQLMAVLGHDLRNPLNAISASAFQLARGPRSWRRRSAAPWTASARPPRAWGG